jgi:uroporphyrinogen-III synthase
MRILSNASRSANNKLNECGFEVDAFPSEKASSEALLALSEVKMLTDKDILIFRGKGGRETLKQGLERRNTVEYIEAYRFLSSLLMLQVTLHH